MPIILINDNLFLQQFYEFESAKKTRELEAKTRELQRQELESAELETELQLHKLQSAQKTRELEAKTRELEDKTRQLKVLSLSAIHPIKAIPN